MNYFKLIPALWKTKGIIQEEIKEAQMPTSSGNPGWKTSEFWFHLASQAGILWGAVQGFIPPQYAAMISVGGIAIYTIARTIAKAVSDIQTAKAMSSTVTTTQPVTTVTTPA